VDPEFKVESEEDSVESESDYSDDDDDDDSDAGSNSDFDSEKDLSEEGMDWDEMERQLEEEDKRAASRRQANLPPQPVKTRP
jgi:hypothetical protein